MERSFLQKIIQRLDNEPRKFIQVLYGPRQVGKSTLVHQYLSRTSYPSHFALADTPEANSTAWISAQFEAARSMLVSSGATEVILVMDEIQKIDNWSAYIKQEWDLDTIHLRPIKVILLGSSRLLLQQGLTESLAGRYETMYIPHWSLSEMQEAFGVTSDQFIWFGGYPGSASLMRDETRWKNYVKDALIETSVSRDILMLTRVDKPSLLRRLFETGCQYSGQILSLNKIIGQLPDAGNTTTLSHYLHLLDQAGLLGGLEKYSPNVLRQRASSPKFQVHNTALMSALHSRSMNEIKQEPKLWGRWVESAIGARLLNQSLEHRFDLTYWRHRNDEIDFVISNKNSVIGLEVKSAASEKTSGMEAFRKTFQPDKILMIGRDGIPIEDFLKLEIKQLFN